MYILCLFRSHIHILLYAFHTQIYGLMILNFWRLFFLGLHFLLYHKLFVCHLINHHYHLPPTIPIKYFNLKLMPLKLKSMQSLISIMDLGVIDVYDQVPVGVIILLLINVIFRIYPMTLPFDFDIPRFSFWHVFINYFKKNV